MSLRAKAINDVLPDVNQYAPRAHKVDNDVLVAKSPLELFAQLQGIIWVLFADRVVGSILLCVT